MTFVVVVVVAIVIVVIIIMLSFYMKQEREREYGVLLLKYIKSLKNILKYVIEEERKKWLFSPFLRLIISMINIFEIFPVENVNNEWRERSLKVISVHIVYKRKKCWICCKEHDFDLIEWSCVVNKILIFFCISFKRPLCTWD